ncbi:hypothetical protein DUNSADRAFT_8904 [Dunaliella salina]|nr:hypothetical protein DUNSADRAFT_8904 [Dunaliella salina]|eukprot:KAF5834440.1 hypothetical protein DUNSADRAFT_8904 [Dunaliella salina]
MLNQIAAHLPGGFSAKQVQRLLKKHEVMVDEGMVRKKARQAEERTRLTAAYQRHRLKPQYLEAIAEDMPGMVTVQQVLRMLRKHGLVDGGVKRASRQLQEVSPIGSDEEETGGTQRARKQRAGSEEAPLDGSRRDVPQPDSPRVLQALKAMEHAHEGRWMDPQAAVAWVQSKLSAAEALWAETQPPHVDYALVMEAEEDEAFFMTDYSQELLEAAGIRNDAGDYYKIPGNSTPAWRASMRHALEGGLQRLDTQEADELYVQLRRREAEQAEQAAAKAAAAEVEAARARAMGGFGASKAAQGKGRKSGGRLTKKQQQEEQLRRLDQQLLDDDDAGAVQPAGPKSRAPKKAVSRADEPSRGGGGRRGGGSDLEGSLDSDSSGNSSDSSASSGLGASDADEEEARALPQYSESDAEEEERQQQQKQERTNGKRSAGEALHRDGSDGEGDVEPTDEARKKVRPLQGTGTNSSAKAFRAVRPSSNCVETGSIAVAQHPKGEGSASPPGNREGGRDQGGKANRHERVPWGGGSKADVRKAALTALAARRGLGTGLAAGGTPTSAKQHGTPNGEAGDPQAGGGWASQPSRLPAAGDEGPRERSLNRAATHENDKEGSAAGRGEDGKGGKKRRLMRQGGKENSEAGAKEAAPAGNAGVAGEMLEDMLEDF